VHTLTTSSANVNRPYRPATSAQVALGQVMQPFPRRLVRARLCCQQIVASGSRVLGNLRGMTTG
jgi:hypothetical protein